MNLRYVYSDEWYPVHTLVERPDFPGQVGIELTDEELADYQAAVDAFDRWQKRLHSA